MASIELKDTLLRVLSVTADRRDLTRLLHICIGIARVQLHRFHARSESMLERAGYSIEDVAVLAVEQIFTPQDGDPVVELRRYLYDMPISLAETTDAELLISLRKLIGIKVARSVAEVSGEVDPHYRRILRNVHDCVRSKAPYRSIECFDGTLHFPDNGMDPALHLPPMDNEELLRRMFASKVYPATTSDFLNLIFSILAEQTECRRACAVHFLTAVIREYHELLLIAESPDDRENAPEYYEGDIDECKDSAVASIRAKTLLRYVEQGVITASECEAYCAAGTNLCEDLIRKEPQRLFDYYNAQFPNRSYEAYRTNGRARFEYVMQKIKDTFINELRRRFG